MTDFTLERNISKIKQLAANNYQAFAYEAITVNGTVKSLTIPEGTKYALLELESSVTSGVVARYLETKSSVVSTTVGMGIRDGWWGDSTLYGNLAGFQITQAQAGTHVLHVQYYK